MQLDVLLYILMIDSLQIKMFKKEIEKGIVIIVNIFSVLLFYWLQVNLNRMIT